MIKLKVRIKIEEWADLKYATKEGKILKTNLYKISTFGRIYSCRRNKFIKPFIDTGGYHCAMMRLNPEDNKKLIIIHRAVATTFIPTDNYTLEVNHKKVDDSSDKDYNHVNNLEWVTPYENMEHSLKEGLNPTSLTFSEIKKACELMSKPNWTYDEILKELGYEKNFRSKRYYTLYDLYNRGTYKFISKDYNLLPPRDKRFKYNDDDVRRICALVRDGFIVKEIVKQTGISFDFVSNVRSKKIKKEISDQYF